MNSRQRTAAMVLALAASGEILPGHKGEEFYHRALSKKATRGKKVNRKQRQKSQRRNRRKR